MTLNLLRLALAGGLVLASGCAQAPLGEAGSARDKADFVADPAERPANAHPGACYGKDFTPAVIEVVTEQVLIEPARTGPDGSIITPARHSTRRIQRVVTPRRVFYVEVPCPNQLPPDFVASLQRALKARGLHDGPITGRLDAATRRAVRAFQAPLGIETDILSLQAARLLGLAPAGPEAQ